MKLVAKVIALPLLLVLAFAINAYASLYFAAYLFPRVTPRPYLEMVSAAVVGGIAASAVVSWPLVRLYGARASLAAIAVAAPVIALRVSDLSYYAGTHESRIIVMFWVEGLIYPVAIFVGVWLLSRRARARSANAA